MQTNTSLLWWETDGRPHQSRGKLLTKKQWLTCPSSGALTLVLVEGQQGADTLVGTGVVRVARGVLGSLTVQTSEAQGAAAGGAAWYRYTSQHGHWAVPSIQAESGLTGVLVLAVLTQKARCTPGHTNTHTHTNTNIRHGACKGLRANHPRW